MPEQVPDISITLSVNELNVVLDTLYDGRHRVVWPVIQKVLEQAQRAERAQREQTPRLAQAD
jgi:uncharacterized protein YllA (UPF0747 family)